MSDQQSVGEAGTVGTAQEDAGISGVDVIPQEVHHLNRHSLLLHGRVSRTLILTWHMEHHTPLPQPFV